MVRRRWPLYACYAVPGIFLAVWMELVYGHSRPVWLVFAQIGVIGLPVVVSAYTCGKRKWFFTLLVGNALHYLSSWTCLTAADHSGGAQWCMDPMAWYAPCSFHVELLTGLFLLELMVQWLCYAMGKESGKGETAPDA